LVEITFKINPNELTDNDFIEKAVSAYRYEAYKSQMNENATLKVMALIFGKKDDR